MIKTALLSVFCCVFLIGCTDNGLLFRSNGKDYVSNDKNGVYKIGEPYQINNIWYRPEENYDYREVGIASWYGPDFHKGVTANGETYNMHAMSAAHKTLPLPSVVKVTNLDNGKFVVVRVNDRGPFVNNRIIDLSKAAAEQLDFIDKGTAKVRVEVLKDESKSLKKKILDNGGKVVGGAPISDKQEEQNEPISLMPESVVVENEAPIATSVTLEAAAVNAADAPLYSPKTQKTPTPVVVTGNYYIQAGAFSHQENALAVQKRLSSFGQISVSELNKDTGTIYRVRIGPFETGEQAAELMEHIEQAGYSDIRLIQER